MRKIKSGSDYKEIQQLGKGFVYNDFSPSGGQPDDNILHRASCRWLKMSNLNVDKYFFKSMREAEDWLETHRGENWRRCMTCFGG